MTQRKTQHARTLAAALLLCLPALAAFAQAEKIEKGSRDDLKGAATAFVDTNGDVVLRDFIVGRLKEELPELSVVESRQEAALVVRFVTAVHELPMESGLGDPMTAMQHQSNPDYVPPPRNDRSLSGQAQRRRSESRIIPVQPMKRRPATDAPDARTRRIERRAWGWVFKPAGEDLLRQVLKFEKIVRVKTETAAEDFVRKFAREYRKANPPEPEPWVTKP
jgi:hypothetical protein